MRERTSLIQLIHASHMAARRETVSQKDRLRSAPEGTTGWEGENEQSDSKWCAMKKKADERGEGGWVVVFLRKDS